jgi:hypothetical protein
MDKQVVLTVIAVVGTLVGTLGASLIGFFAQREGKELARLRKQVEDYRVEIVSRIALERVAMRLLHENGLAQSTNAAQNMLRSKAEEMCGCRPTLTPHDVRPNNMIAIRE